MSSGVVHVKASAILSVGFGIGALLSQDTRLLECAGGALAGILLSPDLDVDARNISYKIIKQKTGWFGAKVWGWFWRGYRKSFKHGQFASHFPIFSTMVRLLYAYFWIIFVPHLFLKLPNLLKLSAIPNWELMFVLTFYAKIFFSHLFLYGLVSSDTIHYFLDLLTTESK